MKKSIKHFDMELEYNQWYIRINRSSNKYHLLITQDISAGNTHIVCNALLNTLTDCYIAVSAATNVNIDILEE